MTPKLETGKIKNYFDYDAYRFADNRWFGSQSAQYDYLITKKVLVGNSNFCSTDNVLEIGCGPGVWTKALSRNVAMVKAIDISSNMIKEAKLRVKEENVIFEAADFLKYHDNQKYDKIISIRAIEYMPDKLRAVNKIYDLLKPGGKVIIITKTTPTFFTFRSWLGSFLKAFLRIKKKKKNAGPEIVMSKISPQELKTLFSLCGFGCIKVSPVILRLPWFFRGSYWLPFGYVLFKFCNIIVRKVQRSPALLNHIFLFFSESYLIQAEK